MLFTYFLKDQNEGVFFIAKKEQLNLVVFEFIKIKLKLFRNKQ